MRDYLKLTSNFTTIIDFLRFGISEANAATLAFGHGTESVKDDIYNLIIFSLNLPFDINPYLLGGQLTAEEKTLLAERLSQRIQQRIPVAYLINKAYFCGLEFYVDSRVLIPRSPISELIESQFSPWVEPENVHRILDLCTGSACIAIACSYAFPEAIVDAIDISSDALAVAEMNCATHENNAAVNLILSDCWNNAPKEQYDIIVSNPPYVSDEEMSELPMEYNHEPQLALRADNNGLAIVEKILAQAAEFLTDDGILVVEVGNSEQALVEAFPNYTFTWLEFEHGGSGVFLLTKDQLQQGRL